MGIFVLILIYGTGRMDGGITSFSYEFSSFDRCKSAAMQIQEQNKATRGVIYSITCSAR